MERLTRRMDDGSAVIMLHATVSKKATISIAQEQMDKLESAVERLAAYEDTELTPEEIMDRKLLTGWISFSEKMPAEDEEILVSNGEWVDIDTMVYDVDGWYLDSGRDFEGLAWIPLPEPWEGES